MEHAVKDLRRGEYVSELGTTLHPEDFMMRVMRANDYDETHFL